MQPLPVFPLFPDPVKEGVFKQSGQPCGLCGKVRGWLYAGPAYGKGDNHKVQVCPWCIADGSAAAKGLTFNDATIYPCLPGSPQMSPADIDEVESRTPGFTTWQGNHWMMCCGCACVYLGEADSHDLTGRWSGAVSSILGYGCNSWSPAEKDNSVRSVVKAQGPCAYVFRCQVCGELKGYWDIH